MEAVTDAKNWQKIFAIGVLGILLFGTELPNKTFKLNLAES